MDDVSSQVTASAVAVWIIQQLKSAPWFPWIARHTDTANRVVALILAAISAAGISIAYGWNGDTFTVSVAGLTPYSVATFLWRVATNVAWQELIYRSAVKRAENDQTRCG